MKAFSSIESFRHVKETVKHYCQTHGKAWPVLNYTGTVKLHGTNAGIRLTPAGKVIPQNRTRILAPDSDNFGFAGWVHAHENEIRTLLTPYLGKDGVTVFGEWAGKGIQKKVAVSLLDKHFIAFSLFSDEEYKRLPKDICNPSIGFRNILEIPTYTAVIDFADPAPVLEKLAELTLAVEKECPWGKYLGVTGIGEGIVWTCDERPFDTDLWFKTKGLEHKKHDKVKIEVDPVLLESIEAVLEQILPEWRLEQGISYLRENNFPVDPRSTGEYLKWISKDILKEDRDVIEANKLDWGRVNKAVQFKARQYFMDQINKN